MSSNDKPFKRVKRGTRKINPMYYDADADWFDGWTFHSVGWAPASGEEVQHPTGRGEPNSTDVNQFHIRLNNTPYAATIMVGPEKQRVMLSYSKGDVFEDDYQSETIETPFAPYVVFAALLRDPEQFL